jgi:hypothetical protein
MEEGCNRMSNIVEEILKNEIEVLKSKYLPEDTGHLRTAVNVLEERIKELPVSDQAYFTAHNIQLEMMKSFDERLDGYNNTRTELWNRQWAIEQALKFNESSKIVSTVDSTIETADRFYDYINTKIVGYPTE